MQALLLLSIIVPFLGAFLCLLMPAKTCRIICVVSAALSFAATFALLLLFVFSGRESTTHTLLAFGETAILGVTIDNLSVLIGVAVNLVGLFVCIYSLGYMSLDNKEHPNAGSPRYFFFMQLFIGAMAGLVFSSTLIGQLFFFEITGACSWGLIGYYESEGALKAAVKALIVTHIASLGLYLAAAILFSETNTFALGALAGVPGPFKTVILLAILFAGWGKSAQFPLHTWLPDAMEAPTPVSAYLHAGSMVNIGVYIFARALYSAGEVSPVVGIVGAVAATITLIYSFFMYLPQTDLKRLLVYSTMAQLAYVFLALSLSAFGAPLAFAGGIAHIFNHAFAKSLFFLVAGSFSFSTGTRLLPQLHGVLGIMPVVGIGFTIAAFAIGGAPPMNLFFSKFEIFAGGFEASAVHGALLILVLIAILESIGTFGWFLAKFGETVLGTPSEAVVAASPLPKAMRVALLALTALTLSSFLMPPAWLQ